MHPRSCRCSNEHLVSCILGADFVLKMQFSNAKGKTFPCLIQTGESFALHLRSAHSVYRTAWTPRLHDTGGIHIPFVVVLRLGCCGMKHVRLKNGQKDESLKTRSKCMRCCSKCPRCVPLVFRRVRGAFSLCFEVFEVRPCRGLKIL